MVIAEAEKLHHAPAGSLERRLEALRLRDARDRHDPPIGRRPGAAGFNGLRVAQSPHKYVAGGLQSAGSARSAGLKSGGYVRTDR